MTPRRGIRALDVTATAFAVAAVHLVVLGSKPAAAQGKPAQTSGVGRGVYPPAGFSHFQGSGIPSGQTPGNPACA